MPELSRRNFFVKTSLLSTLAFRSFAETRLFFKVIRKKGRWIFLSPTGNPFWSLGINHIDSATLRYSDSNDVWWETYQNSTKKWLETVRQDLMDWHFNTVGWVQEVVTINEDNHRHSRPFTFEEYQWFNMPYCHLLPFAETHQWEMETRLPDFYSKGFEDWCDYVARDHCARMKNDPKLIGYFYTDCPTWVHTKKWNQWRGPLFDPEMLDSEKGRQELTKLASRYYRVTHDAIRRYDNNHLILGDRYEANAPLPEQVVQAAVDYVDVLSFQCFGTPENIQQKMSYWAGLTKKPILVADSAQWLPHPKNTWPPAIDRRHDPGAYARVLDNLIRIPECVGFHLCGAYLKNKTRRYGLKDHQDKPDFEMIKAIRDKNVQINQWVKNTFS